MKIIYTDEEFRSFYYYKSYKPSKYPKSYPCVVKQESEDCGLMGDVTRHYVKYLPESYSFDDVLKNAAEDWEFIC